MADQIETVVAATAGDIAQDPRLQRKQWKVGRYLLHFSRVDEINHRVIFSGLIPGVTWFMVYEQGVDPRTYLFVEGA